MKRLMLRTASRPAKPCVQASDGPTSPSATDLKTLLPWLCYVSQLLCRHGQLPSCSDGSSWV